MKNAMKKLLSLALALVLVVGVFPMAAFATENEPQTASIEDLLDNRIVKKYLAQYADCAEEIIAEIIELKLDTLEEILDYLAKWEAPKDKPEDEPEAPKDEPEDEPEAPKDEPEDEPEETTYTITLVVYEEKDNTRKEWGTKSVTLTKNSTNVTEMVAKSGYGEYESVEAKVNGKSVGRAEFVIADGDQVDLYIVPASKGTPDKNEKPGNKPADKEENNKPSSKPENNKPENTKPGKGEKVTLRVWHNDGTSNYTDISCRTTDNLLDVINSSKELRNLSRKGYELIGWAFEANNDLEQEWIAAQHTVADDDDLRVYADWKETVPGKGDKPNNGDKNEKGDVLLKIYLNGSTKNAAKVVDMKAYAKDGKITLTEAEKVVRKYYEEKYSDDDMDVDGLFTAKTWNKGDYSMKNAKKSVEVNEDGDTVIYVMVRDAQKISSGTADTSNPKTGDNIMMVVSVMVMSGAALAYVFSKKRAVR